jgi:hypothetical protein
MTWLSISQCDLLKALIGRTHLNVCEIVIFVLGVKLITPPPPCQSLVYSCTNRTNLMYFKGRETKIIIMLKTYTYKKLFLFTITHSLQFAFCRSIWKEYYRISIHFVSRF